MAPPRRQSRFKNLQSKDDNEPGDRDYEKVAKKFSTVSCNLDDTKTEVLNLIQAYDDGITEDEMNNTMSKTNTADREKAINQLIREGKVELHKRGSVLIYKVRDARLSANHSALLNSNNISVEEKVVYKVVESAGSKGIWNRDIRNQTKIPLQQMSKALKQLETKKLIKAVKSVTASKRKLYMLYGLEPDKSVTGGAWYSGTEFESEYVQVLHEQCYQFIKRRLVTACESKDFLSARDASLVSSQEVKDYIEELKISTVKLTLQDIEMVLETVVYDGLIEKISVPKDQSDPQMDVDIEIKKEKPDISTGCDDDDTSEQTQTTKVIPPKDRSSITADKSKPMVSTSDEEDLEQSNFSHYYRALSKLVTSSGVMRSPCGQCPYIHECRPGAVINPESCLYFERWFST